MVSVRALYFIACGEKSAGLPKCSDLRLNPRQLDGVSSPLATLAHRFTGIAAFPAQDRGIQSLMQNTIVLSPRRLPALCMTLCMAWCMALSGCSNFLRVYKADLVQGNLVTREMADKLKPGMTPSQVRYVLGTPLLTDTLNPRRWDYLYDYVPGTYARKGGLPEVDNRRLTVWFENGVLSKIEGSEQMPESNPATPESRDKTLTAEPL